MCEALCVEGDIKIGTCEGHHLGKDVVLSGQWGADRIVLKATFLNPEQYEQIYWQSADKKTFYPDFETFTELVQESVEKRINITLSEKYPKGFVLLNKLWTSDVSSLTNGTAVMNNVWYLIQQNEYILSKLFETSGLFPKVLGSCGHIYAVEYVKPLANYFGVLSKNWEHTFEKRAELALKLLHLTTHLKTAFPLTLHICDMKIGHFGEDKKGKLKLLDTDMALFEPVLLETMVNTQSCNTNEECSFIDCDGRCNYNTGSCLSLVTNTNLQRLCKNVLMGQYFGLLGPAPPTIAQGLQKELQHCISRKDVNDSETGEIINKIERLLKTAV
ncbi:protein FAM69C-like isoform X2 [Limulus polyphemus]|nr:protein FAM69C-like isoform X2 [Limulus polyphemus]